MTNKLNTEDSVVNDNLTKLTGKYPLVKVCITPVQMATVPNIVTGGDRLRRCGAAFTLGILPEMDKMEQPIMINSDLPILMLDADSLSDLEERVHLEVTTIFNQLKDNIAKNEENKKNEE